MKKILILFMLLLMPGLKALAQVTAGSNKQPESFSVLEIISNKNAGLRMPQLSIGERDAMTQTPEFMNVGTTLAKGLTIYNTTIDCLEYWNGKVWISQCDEETPIYGIDPNATVTSCLPYMFNYQTMTLTASYTGETPASYQWVVNGNPVAGANTDTFAYTPSDLELYPDDLGNRKTYVNITCQMEVNGEHVQAADYEILVVKASPTELSPIYVKAWNEEGTALVKTAFAHVNLGDVGVIDPCQLSGWLFQWGRVADDHQLRNLTDENVWPNGVGTSNAEVGAVAQDSANPALNDLDENGQVLPGRDQYGKFIKSVSSEPAEYDWRSTRKDNLWGNATGYYDPEAAVGDPCPKGWKVPSQKQWSAIYTGNTISGIPDDATANTWTNLGTFDPNSISGYKLSEALYLPAAGGRNLSDASFGNVGTHGNYWSSTVTGTKSYFVNFSSTSVSTASDSYRAIGRSVRCVIDKLPPVDAKATVKSCIVSLRSASSFTRFI
ncbi:hypothetical protein D0T84_10840 [Dysgonomonas sp. 521]|uniref:FISUMP domain-containing protein n=1 Tax=Dysgonomonas sp. 521 TaxID=2302932 RepID=UPI0013D29644|nr:FISUMP domain-containing protein [Dysgonomonas sp. 521]NDV95407.1 hypothetical protein [Dysgonomonas sp. 521]